MLCGKGTDYLLYFLLHFQIIDHMKGKIGHKLASNQGISMTPYKMQICYMNGIQCVFKKKLPKYGR